MRRSVVFLVAALLVPSTARGQYLDPGSASIVVQAIVAAFVAVGATLKLYWKTISGFFNRRRSREKSEQ